MRVLLIMSSVFLLACNGANLSSQPGKIAVEGSKNAMPGSGNGSPVDNAVDPSSQAQPPQVVAGAPEEMSEAQAPAVIAGGFLSCGRSESSKAICYLQDDTMRKLSIPDPEKAVFQFSADGAKDMRVISYRLAQSGNSAPLYFLELSSLEKGTLEILHPRLAASTASFSTSKIAQGDTFAEPTEPALSQFATDVIDAPRIVGDGNLNQEADGCVTSKDLAGFSGSFPVTGFTIPFHEDDIDTIVVDIEMDICGLETLDANVSIGLVNGPLQTIKLPPTKNGRVRLFSGFNLTSGDYVITVNGGKGAAFTDDFIVRKLQVIPR